MPTGLGSGSATGSGASVGIATGSAADKRIVPQDCPPNDKAASMLARALETEEKVVVLKCVPGNFPESGWAFVAWAGEPDGATDDTSNAGPPRTSKETLDRLASIRDAPRLHHTFLRNTGILIADTSRLATFHEQGGDETTTTKSLKSVDFDADGVDELIEETEYTRRGVVLGHINVFRVNGNKLKAVVPADPKSPSSSLGLQLRYNDSGMDFERGITNCEATWALSKISDGTHGLVITRTTTSGPNAADACPGGTASYVMRSGMLTKT